MEPEQTQDTLHPIEGKLFSKYKYILVFALCLIAIGGSVIFFYKKQSNAPQVNVEQTNDQWNGTWVRENSTNFDNAILAISNSINESFDFDLSVFNGNMGEIGGEDGLRKAYISDNTATFKAERDEIINDTDTPCELTFTITGDSMNVEETDACSYFAGASVFFSGTYHKNGTVKELTMETTDLFAGKQSAYLRFKNLVGTSLKSFDESVGSEDDSYDDDLKANIGEFFVPHNALTTSMVGIGDDGTIWAAVSDWGGSGEDDVLRYYTTSSVWRDKAPQFITEFAGNTYKILYMSGKDKK